LALLAVTLPLAARAETLPEPPPDAILAEVPFLDSQELNRIFVNLAPAGDREFRLLLDTGASDSVLTPKYARELGVTVRRVRDRPNERPTRLGRDLQFWVDTDSSDTASRTGWEYGLLGGTFLAEYVLDLDFAARTVRFIDADKWQVPKSAAAANEAVIPLRVTGNRPFVRITVEGKEVEVLLDTGAPFGVDVSGASAKRAGFEKEPIAKLATGGVLGPIESYLVEAEKIGVGPFEFGPAPVVYSPHGGYNQGGSTDSLIGYDLLSHFHVRIDYRHKRLWLRRESDEPLAWFGQSWESVRRVGILAFVDGAGIWVQSVLPGSAAAKLGIRPGDQIEFHGATTKSKALEETLATIESGGRLIVVRGSTEESAGEQIELGGEKPVTPAN
jgi:predicted aspartyl protease